ncbi:S41 family peptidase [Xylanibacillus composti]|uniref:PDZ domain-containing protein n=1 Tax=Xylanibacillus composti TaxID=1572762 RepID=A0A8J4M126_9BACL|nr:S41 family peptidase [Xylanibacillus composti]MDT9725577.1 S41 family peptidase [Xylanibacillus composti]GIQ67670.1 hypothetical protein XYCOK13_04940 [Xylanibacillus composti]
MSWKKSFLFILTFSLLMTAVPVAAAENDDIYLEVKELLSALHVNGMDMDEFKSDTIDGLLEELDDPYTEYFTAEEWRSFQSGIEQQYVGVGIRIAQDDKGIYVVEVFEDSPAKKGGMYPGDYIIRVNQESMIGKSLDELTARVMGLENTAVIVTVLRDGEEKDLRMIRKQISVPSVTGGWFERESVGYIKVSSFSLDANLEFARLMEQFEEQGMQALLLDLRDNPGGYLNTAQLLAKHFVKEGILIHTRDRNQEDIPVRIVGGKNMELPVYVLVNEGSASASEVLAGALQDYGVAKVVGTQTFGKGSVQQSFLLSNGGVLKITVEEYFTPNNRQVNHVGITPDYEVHGTASQVMFALRAAGAEELTLRIAQSGWSLNGVSFPERLRVIERDGKLFVQVRTLAAMAGESISWDGKAKEVVFGGGARFASGSEAVVMENGINYVNVEAFGKQFPAFRSWKEQQDWVMHFADHATPSNVGIEDEAA